jgi:hypothetical protein
MLTDTDTEDVLVILATLRPPREKGMKELVDIIRGMLAGMGVVFNPHRGSLATARELKPKDIRAVSGLCLERLLSFTHYSAAEQAAAINNVIDAYPWMTPKDASKALVHAVGVYKHDRVRRNKAKEAEEAEG